MPIYDQSYAHWKGRLEGHIFRWLPITLNNIRLVFRSKIFKVLFILGLIPFVIRGGMIILYHYFTSLQSNVQFAATIDVNGLFCHKFLMSNQIFGVIAMCLFAGTPLIANDMRAGAMEVYFYNQSHYC